MLGYVIFFGCEHFSIHVATGCRKVDCHVVKQINLQWGMPAIPFLIESGRFSAADHLKICESYGIVVKSHAGKMPRP